MKKEMTSYNSERMFLVHILSFAGNPDEQLRFLEQLGCADFSDPFYCEIFQACCNILLSGQQLNLETLALYFRKKVDLEMLRKICLEMFIRRLVDCTPAISLKLQAEVENLKMLSLDRRYKGSF